MLNSELVAAAAAAAVIFVVFCVTHERLQSDTVYDGIISAFDW